MPEKKKIILIGPPGSGKTTITKVFFKKANPLKLLNESLEPSRGINSNLFCLMDSKIAIFDLAGQENNSWFSNAQNVFEQAKLIISMFDIRRSVEEIVAFLIKILKKKKLINSLQNCDVFALLHKIDNVHNRYVYRKIETIHNFFKAQYKTGGKIKIFGTSIKKPYLYNTFLIILKILKKAFERKAITITQSEQQVIDLTLSIFSKLKTGKKYTFEEIQSDLTLYSEDLANYLNKLEDLKFIKRSLNGKYIKLTNLSEFLIEGLTGNKMKQILGDKKEEFELLQTLLSIREVAAEEVGVS